MKKKISAILVVVVLFFALSPPQVLSLIHISEPTRH